MAVKKRGLGRGLDALLGAKPKENAENSSEGNLTEIDVDLIKPGKFQPRTKMDMMKLRELADSIKAQGMVQPVIIRSIGKDQYELLLAKGVGGCPNS